MASSSVRETTVFEIQTRDVRNPPEALRGPLKCKFGRFPFSKKFGNSGWDGNGTHVFQGFHWKVPGNNWNFKKVVLFSRWKISGEKA